MSDSPPDDGDASGESEPRANETSAAGSNISSVTGQPTVLPTVVPTLEPTLEPDLGFWLSRIPTQFNETRQPSPAPTIAPTYAPGLQVTWPPTPFPTFFFEGDLYSLLATRAEYAGGGACNSGVGCL